MLMIDIVRRSSRSLLSAKTRTILTAFAIAVGTFALTLTLGASNGAQNYANSIIRNNFDPTELIVTNDESVFSFADTSKPKVYDESFGTINTGNNSITQVRMLTDGDLNRIKNIPGIASVNPAVSLSLQYITRDGQKKYVGSLQTYNAYKQPDLLAGSIPAVLPDKSIIIPEGYLEPLGFTAAKQAVGQTVRLSVRPALDQSKLLSAFSQGGVAGASEQLLSQKSSSEEQFTVAAVTKKPSTFVQPGTELNLYASNNDVIRLNDFSTQGTTNFHKYLTANVKVIDGNKDSVLLAAQEAIKKAGYSAQSVKDTEKTLTQIIKVLQGIVSVFGLIAIIASVFGVVNTMYISVLQRTREIGLMKALGMHKKDVARLFRLEAGLIGLLGGLLGSVAAVALGTALNPYIARKLGLGSEHLLDFRYSQIALLIVLLILVAIIAGLLPARKAAKLDPIEALRAE